MCPTVFRARFKRLGAVTVQIVTLMEGHPNSVNGDQVGRFGRSEQGMGMWGN